MKLILAFILFAYLTVSFIVDLAQDTIVNSLNRTKYYELKLSSIDDFLAYETYSEDQAKIEKAKDEVGRNVELGIHEYRLLKNENNEKWSSISLIKTDESKNEIWNSNIFTKQDLYFAAEPKMILDSISQKVTVAYTLPNDSLTTVHLVAKDMNNGSDLWQMKIPIKMDYATLEQVAFDENHIYLLGNAVLQIRRLPWQSAITVVFYIVLNKEDGAIVTHDYYGEQYPYHSTSPEKLIVNNSTIEVYGTYKYYNFSNLVTGTKRFHWVMNKPAFNNYK